LIYTLARQVIPDPSIFTPDQQTFWSEQDNLHWHRKTHSANENKKGNRIIIMEQQRYYDFVFSSGNFL